MKISNQVSVRSDWMFKNKLVHTPSPGFRREKRPQSQGLSYATDAQPSVPSGPTIYASPHEAGASGALKLVMTPKTKPSLFGVRQREKAVIRRRVLRTSDERR